MKPCPRCGGLVVHEKHCESETVKALRQQLAEAIAEGRRLERAAIVADLRAWEAGCEDFNSDERWLLKTAAARYERGEHIKEGM